MKRVNDLYYDLFGVDAYARESTVLELFKPVFLLIEKKYGMKWADVLYSTYQINGHSFVKYTRETLETIHKRLLEINFTNEFHRAIRTLEGDVSVISQKKTLSLVMFSTLDLRFQIVKDSKKRECFYSKVYKVSDIRDIEILNDESVTYKRSANIGKVIAGGLLFGGAGAIAGALSPSDGESVKKSSKYAVRILLNDFSLALVELPCDTREVAHRIVATFNLLLENKST